jgi:hypothetical protein
MVPVFRGTVDDQGRLQIPSAVRALMTKHLSGLAGKPVAVTVKVWRNQRSSQANRYYFGVVIPLLSEATGYERDEMHELLAMRFLRIEDDKITGSPRRKRTPQTDTKEFAEYVDRCIRFAAELGVYVPAPGEVAA